jgi:biopolymer transport protein ExbD
MKFPRNARIFRGRLDVAPFAAVFFLLAIFLLLSCLVYTPGVRLELPVASGLPGTDRPTVAVAIDAQGRLYFENQWIEEAALKTRLKQIVAGAREPLELMVQADKAVTYEQLLRLTLLARDAGITNTWLATLPSPTALPSGSSFP